MLRSYDRKLDQRLFSDIDLRYGSSYRVSILYLSCFLLSVCFPILPENPAAVKQFPAKDFHTARRTGIPASQLPGCRDSKGHRPASAYWNTTGSSKNSVFTISTG